MSGSPSQRGNTVSRKPKKKLGSTWNCITKACSQPGKMAACGTGSRPGQRCAASQAAHQAMASSRLQAPMKNMSRCGATASRPGEGPEGDLVMRSIFTKPGAGDVDAGQAMPDRGDPCRPDRACGTGSRPGQRCAASQAAHQAMASSRLQAPMKNMSRCGATASRPGEGPEGDLVMRSIFTKPGAGDVDAGQAMPDRGDPCRRGPCRPQPMRPAAMRSPRRPDVRGSQLDPSSPACTDASGTGVPLASTTSRTRRSPW